jgi:hypothetical protein
MESVFEEWPFVEVEGPGIVAFVSGALNPRKRAGIDENKM